MRRFFVFFLISGFCSVLYELIWLRTAMAQFGVTTPLTSIVLSMFMAGLGLGSWASGSLIRRYGDRTTFPALRIYALLELLIGLSAILVPHQLLWGRFLLEKIGASSSLGYYMAAGICLAFTLVPWCAFMGATIPVGMLAISRSFALESRRGFSYLYLSNVFGGIAGAAIPPFMIEALGFRGTTNVASVLNFLLAASAMALSLITKETRSEHASESAVPSPSRDAGNRPLLLLFLTGLTSMGVELVWIRELTPYLGTVVYAFSIILAVYMFATYLGSLIYRHWSARHDQVNPAIWALLGMVAVLPLIGSDPRTHIHTLLRVLLGVAPFSGLLGFLTPMLVDRWSGGIPERAGRAYSVNVLGCIAGPLVSAFILLPIMGERWALVVFALPWFAVAFTAPPEKTVRSSSMAFASLAVIVILGLSCKNFEDIIPHREILRDHTGTVVALGTGMDKRLLVNGIGMTFLTPVTKMMAHMPLALLSHRPANGLVICFGMGTTYRSVMSWGIPTTAVELVPSVPKFFTYYHPDAAALLHSPLSRIVVDDGRRFLERTAESYDVIVIDPPPPIQASASSLLYSKEFYTAARRRMRPGGILQQWLASGDDTVVAAVARSLHESFPEVRAFTSIEGWGVHFLASDRPIVIPSTAELVARLPPSAVADLMAWGPAPDAQTQFGVVLGNEVPLKALISLAPEAPALQDDRPVNEYYLLRHSLLVRRLAPEGWAHLAGLSYKPEELR